MTDTETSLRSEINDKIKAIVSLKKSKFRPRESKVQYAGAVYDHNEITNMVTAILDGWFGLSKYGRDFEKKFAKTVNVKESVFVNSGSSANLIAVAALFSPQLSKTSRLKRGEEVITPAMTFPTTFNPIIQNGLIPVLLDVDLGFYNIRSEDLGLALSKKTRAILIPHTLGNPNDMGTIVDFAEEHNLYLIEDSCDALGSKYAGRMLGSFGTFGTFSFYPAHHITTGEGGAITSNDLDMIGIARSIRDWGRACVCPTCPLSRDQPLFSYNCPLRFKLKIEGMPEDYDVRYIYTNIGFNLKPTEIQAAMGIAQLEKLPEFISARKRNFTLLYEALKKYADYFILPESLPKAEPSWFAFPLTIRKGARLRRRDLIEWLHKRNIEVKNFFAGDITRHPAYKNTRYRIAQPLTNSEFILHNSFFIGIYPGITEEMINFMIATIEGFIKNKL